MDSITPVPQVDAALPPVSEVPGPEAQKVVETLTPQKRLDGLVLQLSKLTKHEERKKFYFEHPELAQIYSETNFH